MHLIQPLASTGVGPFRHLPSFDGDSIQHLPLQNRGGHSATLPSSPSPQVDEFPRDLHDTEWSQSLEMERSESTSLSVMTHDGDQITLSMVSEWQISVDRGGHSSHDRERQYAGVERYQGYAIQYQVEGDLDEGERQALDALMERVSVVANAFFEGDLMGAVTALEGFELDTREFTAMAMRMERSVRYSMAETYKEVSQLVPATHPVEPASVNLPGLSHFVQDVQRMISEVSEYLDRILSPATFVRDLMGQAIERDPRAARLPEGVIPELNTLLDQIARTIAEAPPA